MSEGPIGGGNTVAEGTAALQNAFGGGSQEPSIPDTSTGQSNPQSVPRFGQPKPEAPQQQTQGNSGGGHPAWQSILSRVPEGLHDALRPELEQWDRGVQEKLQQVHSQYEPFKQFLDQQVDPQELSQGYQLMQLLQTDPEAVYRSLAETFGFGGEQGLEDDEYDLGGGPEDQQQFDLEQDPRFQQLKQQQEQLLQGLQQGQQQAVQREAEQWLDSQINEATEFLKTNLGIEPTPQDWSTILSMAATTGSGNEDNTEAFANAVNQYIDMVHRFRNSNRANASAPTVMPPGGGTPANVVTTATMSDKERREYGAARLAQALRDG